MWSEWKWVLEELKIGWNLMCDDGVKCENILKKIIQKWGSMLAAMVESGRDI